MCKMCFFSKKSKVLKLNIFILKKKTNCQKYPNLFLNSGQERVHAKKKYSQKSKVLNFLGNKF